MQVLKVNSSSLPYGRQVLGVFLILLAFYLLAARLLLAPAGYYGSLEQPRFADPWIDRAETIVGGGLLYRDVSTTTPPLINLLLVPPTLVSGWFDHQNPAATLVFMLYFALFNLPAAYVLLDLTADRSSGYQAALLFLFNPLTFGNAVLRRQDEAILVAFFALTLWLAFRQRRRLAAATVGLTLLVKLSGALLVPPLWLRTRDWRYVVLPGLVFALGFAPFLLLAGRDAVFWDIGERHNQHPFQFDGISFGALWASLSGTEPSHTLLVAWSALLLLGALAALVAITVRPHDLLTDLSLLTATVLLLSPKLHCGYLALLALLLAPLAVRQRAAWLYLLFGALALAADLANFPYRAYGAAFGLMLAASLALLALFWRIMRPQAVPDRATAAVEAAGQP